MEPDVKGRRNRKKQVNTCRLHVIIFLGMITCTTVGTGACTSSEKDSDPVEQCVHLLRKIRDTEAEWVKVHAAEYLLWSGYPEGVKEVFMDEEKERGTQSPYRIGIWRVLVQASSGKEKEYWLYKIRQAFLDEEGPDRIHAAETLAKLQTSPARDDLPAVERALQGSDDRLRSYTRWSVMFTSADSFNTGRSAFLNSCVHPDSSKAARELAAYVLGRTAKFSREEWMRLAEAGLSEAPGSTSGLYMLTSAFLTAPDDVVSTEMYTRVRNALSDYQKSKEPGLLSELAYALARKGDESDTLFLGRLLREEQPTGSRAGDADVRAAAAFALIEIGKRTSIPTHDK